jgi:hypothetical protein
VIERFTAAGIPKDNISFARDTFTFNFPGTPAAFVDAFRKYYGPTMTAFEAAQKQGKADELQKQLEELFNSQNKSQDGTSIPATFLRVTVEKSKNETDGKLKGIASRAGIAAAPRGTTTTQCRRSCYVPNGPVHSGISSAIDPLTLRARL